MSSRKEEGAKAPVRNEYARTEASSRAAAARCQPAFAQHDIPAPATPSSMRTSPIVRGAASASPKRTVSEERTRRLRLHALLRCGIQLAFFVLAPSAFSGCFAGIKYLCNQIGGTLPLEFNAFVVQLIAILIFTCICGRFFCGYACAFGALGDAFFHLSITLQNKLGHGLPTVPERLVRPLSLLKYVVLAAICAACLGGSWQAVSDKTPWVGFASLLALSFDNTHAVAFVLLAAVACLMMLRERAFCQFLCPLGAIFSLMPVLPIAEFVRTREHCARRCGRCHETCPVSIWPDADTLEHGECIACGVCAEQCPLSNINQLALQKDLSLAEQLLPHEAEKAATVPKPLRKTREMWLLLRGTEPWVVLLRAVLLLLLCWLVGAVRYVPALSL